MKAALNGHYTDEGLFVLGQSLEAWKFYQQQLEQCDKQIERVIAQMPTARPTTLPIPPKPVAVAPEQAAQNPKKKKVTVGNNALNVDTHNLGEHVRRLCGVNLMEVCGLNLLSVLMLIAEIGVDMSQWTNAKAFCSWLGLCPGLKISEGRVLSRRTRKVANRASAILRMTALVIGRTDTWLGRFYRRKKAHLGAPKAITATARKLACVVYHLLKYQENYVPLDVTIYERNAAQARLRRVQREATELGFELVEKQQAA